MNPSHAQKEQPQYQSSSSSSSSSNQPSNTWIVSTIDQHIEKMPSAKKIKSYFNENKEQLNEIKEIFEPIVQENVAKLVDHYLFKTKPKNIGYRWQYIQRDDLLNDYCGLFYEEYREIDVTTYDQIMEYINHLIQSYYHILEKQDDLPDIVIEKNNEKLIQTFKYILNYFLLFSKKIEEHCSIQRKALEQYTRIHYSQRNKSEIHSVGNKKDEMDIMLERYIESNRKLKEFDQLAESICKILARYRLLFFDD